MPRQSRGIHVKFRKDRNVWEVVEYVGGRLKRHSAGYGSRADAEEALAEIIVQRKKPKRSSVTVGEILAYYTVNHVPTIENPDSQYIFIENLAPFWGDIKLEDVGKAHCLQYCDRRREEFKKRRARKKMKEKDISNETLRRELETLQAAINFARDEGITMLLPPVWKPDKGSAKTRWLTGREAARLIRAAKNARYSDSRDYLPLYILISLYTGARKKAVLGLRWPQVDFKNEIIDFRAQYKSNIKRGAVVPIPRRLLRELKKARKRGTDLGYVVHRNQKPLGEIQKGFAGACEAAGLAEVTPHTLRHTCASWLIQKGFSSSKVAKWLGTTTQIIDRTYGHLAPGHLDDLKKSWG